VAMRITPQARPRSSGRFTDELRDGIRYIAGFAPVRALILLLAASSLTGMPYVVLMPVFAKDILGGGPHTFGLLMASSGVGALIAALWLASRRSVLGLGRVVAAAAVVFGAALVMFSLSRSVWLSAPLLACAGAGMMLQMASSNTLVQTLVDEEVRGRVMSFYTVAFLGMTPFGSLVGGWLGQHIGAPLTVRLGGTATVVAALLFWRKLPELRRLAKPVYQRLGILPEIAEGLGRSTNLTVPPQR
jgi:MFS family permease